jgi:hypothetical protein
LSSAGDSGRQSGYRKTISTSALIRGERCRVLTESHHRKCSLAPLAQKALATAIRLHSTTSLATKICEPGGMLTVSAMQLEKLHRLTSFPPDVPDLTRVSFPVQLFKLHSAYCQHATRFACHRASIRSHHRKCSLAAQGAQGNTCDGGSVYSLGGRRTWWHADSKRYAACESSLERQEGNW